MSSIFYPSFNPIYGYMCQVFHQGGSGFNSRVPASSCETTFQKLELVLTWATLHFVGWVELTPGFVGFRCTQPNLHFAGVIANCETQQRPISEPSPKSFFFDQNSRFALSFQLPLFIEQLVNKCKVSKNNILGCAVHRSRFPVKVT